MERLFQVVERVCFVPGKYLDREDRHVCLFASKIGTSKRTGFYQLFPQLLFGTSGVDPITVANLIVQVAWYNTLVSSAVMMTNVFWNLSKTLLHYIKNDGENMPC